MKTITKVIFLGSGASAEKRISERICERLVDVRAPQLTEQVFEASQTSSQSRVFDVLVPEMAEQLVEAPKNASRDRIQQRNVEQTVDVPVPEVEEELVEASKDFSLDRDQQRSAEDTVEIPTISHAEKVVEIPRVQTRGKTYQGVNTHIQHIVDIVDVENHIIQEKINQMTKHVPRVQFVEKTVESAQLQIIEKIDETSKIQTIQEHFAVLAQLVSHISAILKFADETGEDPFVKVKNLTTDLINKLQDTLQWLDKNHLTENDELGFEQACVSEHFPEKRGRNSNPESEVFMARIFQIWVNHSRSSGPGSESRQFSRETNRPGQSKQRQVWVRQ